MRTQRDLTAAEQAELDALNQAVTDAIQKRTDWLDAKMVETSCLKVGDDIYDTYQCIRLGTVTRIYRYHATQNKLYDTSYSCHYEYHEGENCYGNTSGRGGYCYGTKEDARKYLEIRASMLK